MRYIVTYTLLLIIHTSFAQLPGTGAPEIKPATIEFNGGKYDGYIIEYNAPADLVEDAVKEKFKLEGMKPRETKDFMVYRGIRIALIDSVNPVDAFIKVERKSRKEKDQSVVYFIATAPGVIPDEKVKPGESTQSVGIVSKLPGDGFLAALTSDVEKGVHEKSILNQQATIKKEEKKLADLKEDQLDLEKKLRKLQSDLEYNKKAQERQAAEIEKSKLTLSELMAKNSGQ